MYKKKARPGVVLVQETEVFKLAFAELLLISRAIIGLTLTETTKFSPLLEESLRLELTVTREAMSLFAQL